MDDFIQEDDKHFTVEMISPQREDETNALGSMPDRPMDIDDANSALSGKNDNNGPQELV